YISATHTAVRVVRMIMRQWTSLKKEYVYPVPVFEDYETAAAVLFEYVHAFYNRKRIHSSLGYQTPLQVEVETLTSQMAA
ncbi:IS3 family transposase, partial [Lactiplantibacillus plantarum]|uniref:IS3 family transposase n=1 Tax=Lactiplantibacillus plantarum TaxID=1590 RepID=UPI001F41692A